MIFLAGDIGGTHTRLLLGEVRKGGWQTLARADYPSDQFATFDDLLRLFLETGRFRPVSMVLAVAGPVRHGRVKVTNLPWTLDALELARQHALEDVILLNDFEAQGHALPLLGAEDVVTLQAGEPDPDGVRALIGAGTGLGMAQVVPCAGGWRVIPGEGGHVDFAPRNEAELDLWRHVRKELGRASVESLLSGPGIERIHRYLCQRDGVATSEAGTAQISQVALAEPGSRERQTLRLFVHLYGAVAGNLALLDLPRGGLYLGGGIAPKILPLLQAEGFLEAFLDKAPMGELLKTIPVQVVANEALGLLGAAEVAVQLAEGR